jgi:hypothetical protein
MPALARVKTAWLATFLKVIVVPSATPNGRVVKEGFVTPWIRSTARMLATPVNYLLGGAARGDALR